MLRNPSYLQPNLRTASVNVCAGVLTGCGLYRYCLSFDPVHQSFNGVIIYHSLSLVPPPWVSYTLNQSQPLSANLLGVWATNGTLHEGWRDQVQDGRRHACRRGSAAGGYPSLRCAFCGEPLYRTGRGCFSLQAAGSFCDKRAMKNRQNNENDEAVVSSLRDSPRG